MISAAVKRIGVIVSASCLLAAVAPAGINGYYRQPALHGDTVVFVSEGDLWKVSAKEAAAGGGVATRLTTHPGSESHPAISPDGKTVAFVAEYEGPSEVYTMPVDGGLPVRRTYTGDRNSVQGWTPDGKIIISTDAYSTLPNSQLVLLDISDAAVAATPTLVPLAQAAEGVYSDDGKTLFFTRLRFQGSQTRRYKGGSVQNLWRFAAGDAEAAPLTADFPGTSRQAMYWQERVYFASDRDGLMNLWSMKPDGGDVRQHTKHTDYEVQDPSLEKGRIVYQQGADLWLLDVSNDTTARLAITLDSDFDQMRERWVEKPLEYMTSAHVSADGSRVVMTARGRVFVAPHRQGRLVEVTRTQGVRYRDARFMPDGESLVALSDQSGEIELWKLPANGVGEAEQITNDGVVLRWKGVPSPDGRYVAMPDKNQRLVLLELATRKTSVIATSQHDESFLDLAWSPDSRWLAFVTHAANMFRTIALYNVEDQATTAATTDRFDSYSPAWTPDGKWLYFISDRNLETLTGSPWGTYQPEPFLAKKSRLYMLALVKGLRSPWAPADELQRSAASKTAEPRPAAEPQTQSAPASTSAPASATIASGEEKTPAVTVAIDRDGLAQRLFEVPIPAGDYVDLTVNDKALFWLSVPVGGGAAALSAAAIANENVEVKTVVAEIRNYEMSGDGKKLLIRKGESLYIVDAAAAPADLAKKDVSLAGWMLSVIPREEWRQMFDDAWRLERDYFYDPGMHGVDWKAMRAKYRPLVDRVASRAELGDVLAQMVAELSALHIFVRGGDQREGPDKISNAALGAELVRDVAVGGYRVERIFENDPDEPQHTSPLSRPGVDVAAGDVIASVNGVATLSVPDLGVVLRNQAGKQVLMHIRPGGGGPARDVIVTPIDRGRESDLRYRDWEYSRRRLVEELGGGDLGYVHLRAMGGGDFSTFARDFYPIFTRKGLIIDVRHNRGGNIDSWILGRLMRKAWFTWSQRVGQPPSWNMQYAFRGHMVLLCNEWTASDGEAMSEGFRRLGLGKVIGTRTWGGEIWLSSSNFLVDKGIATAAEYGVYGPEGAWLIEGHGVEPDIVVDNLPHATFKGEDAQLRKAIEHLQQLIREKPIEMPKPPRHPDKSESAGKG